MNTTSDRISKAVDQYWLWHKEARLKRGKENKLINLEMRTDAIHEIAEQFGVDSKLLTKIVIA